MEGWFEAWESMQVEIKEIDESDDQILVTLHQRARGKGSEIELDIETYNVYSFEDGKVTRIELFINRGDAFEAAGMTANLEEEKR